MRPSDHVTIYSLPTLNERPEGTAVLVKRLTQRHWDVIMDNDPESNIRTRVVLPCHLHNRIHTL